MVALQKDEKEIWKYLEEVSRYETRHRIAAQIPRNEKGQFAARDKHKPIKPPGRKGRPRKVREE